MRILFLGDIVGSPARDFIGEILPKIKEEKKIDIVIANAENSAAGNGINAKIAYELNGYEIDALTLGDHVWDVKNFHQEIASLDFLCRPCNIPSSCPGKEYVIIEKNGFKLAVFTLIGQTLMKISADNPFIKAQQMIEFLKDKADAIIVEFHAETTSEKAAMGWFLDGKVAAVVGTHTHIPTADYRLLDKSTAFMTDLGMCGAYKSCLGRKSEQIILKYLDGMPRRFQMADEDVRLSGAIIDIDKASNLATNIEHYFVKNQEPKVQE